LFVGTMTLSSRPDPFACDELVLEVPDDEIEVVKNALPGLMGKVI